MNGGRFELGLGAYVVAMLALMVVGAVTGWDASPETLTLVAIAVAVAYVLVGELLVTLAVRRARRANQAPRDDTPS